MSLYAKALPSNINEFSTDEHQAVWISRVPTGADVMTDEIAERLFVARCDDSSPFSGAGIAGADFDRNSSGLEAAVASALKDVRKAGFEAARVEIEADELADLQLATG